MCHLVISKLVHVRFVSHPSVSLGARLLESVQGELIHLAEGLRFSVEFTCKPRYGYDGEEAQDGGQGLVRESLDTGCLVVPRVFDQRWQLQERFSAGHTEEHGHNKADNSPVCVGERQIDDADELREEQAVREIHTEDYQSHNRFDCYGDQCSYGTDKKHGNSQYPHNLAI